MLSRAKYKLPSNTSATSLVDWRFVASVGSLDVDVISTGEQTLLGEYIKTAQNLVGEYLGVPVLPSTSTYKFDIIPGHDYYLAPDYGNMSITSFTRSQRESVTDTTSTSTVTEYFVSDGIIQYPINHIASTLDEITVVFSNARWATAAAVPSEINLTVASVAYQLFTRPTEGVRIRDIIQEYNDIISKYK